MIEYNYQNNLIGKKQLRKLLGWSFTKYDCMEACSLADELKYLGFKYASQAGISISIEDLKVPFIKNLMIERASKEILDSEKFYLKGKITDVERFQKIIDTWNLTSQALKTQVVYYFKNYDPLNSVYIMVFSGARGNLSQVRQLVGMRGLMADPNGEILKLPIKKNFREGLTITDYLISGYGARKGIIDTALKTANSGYLTRRLIDVAQDILIREKDCLTNHSLLFSIPKIRNQNSNFMYQKILGRVLNKSVFDPITNDLIARVDTQITPTLIDTFKQKGITNFYIRSPLSCNLYRAVCQKCYGWDLSHENLVDIGEAIGILAGQSIGEPGTQLTMRTFHTGGVFTSESREQITSPISGIVKFSNSLKAVKVRTTRGEDVQVTKNSGSIIIIPENESQEIKSIRLLRNTIVFPRNNQYIQKDMVIGEIINLNRQIKNEIKPIISSTGGEIYIPPLSNKFNIINKNKLIWVLEGELYNSPPSSFINFSIDHKINKNSYIFRTKIINDYSGYLLSLNEKKNLYERIFETKNQKYLFSDSKVQKLLFKSQRNCYILVSQNSKIILEAESEKSEFICLKNKQEIGVLLTNSYKTLTGGIYYCLSENLPKYLSRNAKIYFYRKKFNLHYDESYQSNVKLQHQTIIWLEEETHKLDCERTTLLASDGDFILKNFELIPGHFSKITGLVNIFEENNKIQTVTISSGFVYEGEKSKKGDRMVYYPGEIIFSNIRIIEPSYCQYINNGDGQLLIRPIKLYEIPFHKATKKLFASKNIKNLPLPIKIKKRYNFKTNRIIKTNKSLNLLSYIIGFNDISFLKKNIHLQLVKNKITESIELQILERLYLNNYVPAYLKYKNIQSCFILQPDQFIDRYTVLGYLESLTLVPVEIVKFKVKYNHIKQILLISNNHCVKVKKIDSLQKTLNGLTTNNININEVGKILSANKDFYIIQKGRPYFFPSCGDENHINESNNLQYKILSPDKQCDPFNIEKEFSLNYYDINKFSIVPQFNLKQYRNKQIGGKIQFSKFVIKKFNKLYSCLIPRFLKKFKIENSNLPFNFKTILGKKYFQSDETEKSRHLFLKHSTIINSKTKEKDNKKFQLTLIKFSQQPFKKSSKSIGVHSITEDYFEEDANTLFCKNNEFIETGDTIGFLNFEKEITGDIVQGLPRIEEILEARKKKLKIIRVPANQKKNLLTQKSSLDPSFEFRKLGTPVNENEKINPHKLLKVYFNYYGINKIFFCDKKKSVKSGRLIKNFENCYKSFKKVQLFILNSVQKVYNSQGVSINDKHLEVIIKQMTTKVLISSEGATPLLRREVIDLYHIEYINEVIETYDKQPAHYVPLLLGITKAALNNPSFISAASFQETTRVLTKAAIEGRIDWLRGLKENIIIGHLIPAGTGSPTYRHCFKEIPIQSKKLKNYFDSNII